MTTTADATVFSRQFSVSLCMIVKVDDANDTASIKVYKNDVLQHTFTATDDEELTVTVEACDEVIIESGSGTGSFEYAIEDDGPSGR